ncbi:hypothetical protein HMPREF9162_1020 [Selenomonas sp. oral taxon 137 str. F0430]|nr:hypothetical protein HMPREF9162_1020 [Selenomonas sp. oral taxon 137 str. F0430]
MTACKNHCQALCFFHKVFLPSRIPAGRYPHDICYGKSVGLDVHPSDTPCF